MMKRILSLLLVLLLCLGLTACGFVLPQQPAEDPFQLEIVTAARGDSPSSPQGNSADTAAAEITAPAGTSLPAEVTEAPDAPSPAETAAPVPQTEPPAAPETEQALLDEDGWYNTKEEVALYIHQYGKLPGNYITKKEAEDLGWPGGSLEPYAPGKSIGGGYFGNYEGLLPAKSGRKYTECDIDTAGRKSRGAKRIVFSNDGLIYYTGDHYESFELLYGEP